MNESDNRTSLPPAHLEQASSPEQLGQGACPKFTTPVNIHVTSYRKLNHDPDGISVKAVLDGLVDARILADDSAKQVQKVTFESRKSKDERTIIEITEVS